MTSKATTRKTTTRKPTISKTTAFLAKAIEFSGRTQVEIARDAGFPKPNVISMMKSGQMAVKPPLKHSLRELRRHLCAAVTN